MTNREIKHKNCEKLCYQCDTLQENTDQINTYGINYRGYGSGFDSCRFQIQICDKCNKTDYEKWFYESPTIEHEYVETYKYEDDIHNLVDSFIVENQEYVWNGDNRYTLPRQDWIDMKNNVLPDEKYEEYGIYSPRQIKAYEERFPTCNHPINVTHKDGSQGCWCTFGANGIYGQTTSSNVSSKCYGCEHYILRYEEIKEMAYDDFSQFKDYYIGKINYEKYKSKFENK